MNRDLVLLAICQGLFLVNNVTFIAINGLVGLQLAPLGWMATLPVTGYVVGAALSALPVARLQARVGRKRSFQMGLIVAMFSAALCALAVTLHLFWLLVTATLIAGFYSANAALYRFTGPELAAPAYRERAISLVLAGGIAGAVIGPNLASISRTWFAVQYAGSYLALVGVALLSLGVLSFIRFPAHAHVASGAPIGRPLPQLARQPVFIIAVAAAALGYGVMNLLMAATPIAMQICKHPFESVALVLEWHVLGMFVPSFFTGRLIARFGARRLMTAGMLCGTAGLLVLTRIDADSPYGLLLAGYLLFGIALGLVYAPMSTAAMAAMPREKVGIASGVLAMDRVLAGAVALAATGAAFHALLGDGHSFAASVAGSTWVAVVLCALGTALTWSYVRDTGDSSSGEPQHRMHHRRFHL
ncbi:MAG: MFS transporter [Burkholderiaceae bacterium]